MLGTYGGHWDYWSRYHKVTFDGVQRLIIVNPEVTSINVKVDIYSDWKEWVFLDDYSKFTQAIRCIGGDPIGSGVYAGDLYFLLNGWKIYVDHAVDFDGVIYSDDGSNPIATPQNAYAVRTTASNLALSRGRDPADTVVIDEILARLDGTALEASVQAIRQTTDSLKDEAFGRWVMNTDQDTMTLYREDGSVLKVFQLLRAADQPPAYIGRVPT